MQPVNILARVTNLKWVNGMSIFRHAFWFLVLGGFTSLSLLGQNTSDQRSKIGREVAIPRHLQDDEEFHTPILQLIEYGKKVFCANWTDQDGAGRPLTKGTG